MFTFLSSSEEKCKTFFKLFSSFLIKRELHAKTNRQLSWRLRRITNSLVDQLSASLLVVRAAPIHQWECLRMNSRFRSKRVISPKGEGCFSRLGLRTVFHFLFCSPVLTPCLPKGGPILQYRASSTLIATTWPSHSSSWMYFPSLVHWGSLPCGGHDMPGLHRVIPSLAQFCFMPCV